MIYVNLKSSQEFRRCSMSSLVSLRQRKFMSAFRALCHSTLHRRWATRTSKCSAICYIEGETAFRTIHYMFLLRIHSMSLSLNQQSSEILKTFLEILSGFNAKILTSLKTIKYGDAIHMKNCLRRTN